MDNLSIICHHFGNPEKVLTMSKSRISPLELDEVLVQMIACPINPSDLIPIYGAYAHRITLPYIPGYEGVGIVIAVGSKKYNHLLGKRVLPLRGDGTWQQYVKTNVKWAVMVKDEITNQTAAQLYINPLTAYIICKEELALSTNDVLIVNAANSSLGRLFIQLAKILSFTLIAIVRHGKYVSELERLGADIVINQSTESIYDKVMQSTNHLGATAAIDLIGGDPGTRLANCLQDGGHFISIGLLSGKQVNWTSIANRYKIQARIFHLRHFNKKVSADKWHFIFNQLMEWFISGELYLDSVTAKYPFHQYRQAIHHALQYKGKILLGQDDD